jgi:hypothetical protein
MDPRIKASLAERLSGAAARHAIPPEDLSFPSFAAHYSYNWAASAADGVAVAAGLLVLPYTARPGQEAALSPEAAFW